MKKLLLFVTLLLILNVASSQVLKRIGDRVKQKAGQKLDEKVDKTVDDVADGRKKEDKTNNDDNTGNADNTVNTNNEDIASAGNVNTDKAKGSSTALAYSSKYDFVPGEKVVAYEDFSNAAIGDFPTRWNTNGSAEVVTLNQKEGKWLKINNKGYFFPEFITGIPENSTLEFDLGVNNNFAWGNSDFEMYITSLDDRNKFSESNSNHQLFFEFHPLTGKDYTGGVNFRTEYGSSRLSNQANATKWDNKNNLFAHVSVWRQGQRLRIYVNGDKLFDLPKVFEADKKYNALIFHSNDIASGKDDYYVLSNIRLAVGAPDTRNKLITEGKFVTHGILFDVNSDKIKPESYGALRDIGNVLKENASVKVKIVGHTDTDGDDKANMDLSKRRAAAVKEQLVKEFAISADNLEIDGKGETEPADKNNTPEAKANNRRVEFIKM